MFQFEVVGSGARPPWWRTVVLVVLSGFLGLFSVVFSPMSWHSQRSQMGSDVMVMGLAMLVVVALPILLVWRHRLAFTAVLVPAATSLVLPIGNTLAFVALAALLGRRRGPATWLTAGAVGVTSTWVVVADALAQPRGASLIKNFFGETGAAPEAIEHIAWFPVAVVIVAGLATSIGAGLLVRSRRQAATAESAAATGREVTDKLGDEVARRQERERIAREVHDAMGHRLSLLSLHAGALEANAADPRVAESAHLVRESATAAMDDLRSLLGVLREPGGDTAVVPLTRLSEVVRESFGAGQPINSSIFVADADRADPTLSRGVFRIVQELLTNARKHAPGQPVFLGVEGGPATGIIIDCRNPYVGGFGAGEAGTSRGLAGISERAEVLGGTMKWGLDDGDSTFRVHVELPWRQA